MVLHDLTGFQRDLLRTVEKLEDPHGLGIKETLEEKYGFDDTSNELHHGRLYPNLDTLVEKGLVEKGTKDRRTNSYTLSSRGKRELDRYRDWLTGQD